MACALPRATLLFAAFVTAVCVELHAGGAGRGLRFGLHDYLVLTEGGGIPCPPFTIEFWLSPTTPDPGIVLSHYSRWDSRTLFSIYSDGQVHPREFSRRGEGALLPYHFALVADTDKWSVLLNGVPKPEVITPPAESIARCSSATPAYPWVLGCAVESRGSLLDARMGSCFVGLLDELRLWGRALTAEEIQRRMHVPTGDHERGLIRRWAFDQRTSDDAVPGVHWNEEIVSSQRPWSSSQSRIPLVGGPVYTHSPTGSMVEVRLCAAVWPASDAEASAITATSARASITVPPAEGALLSENGTEVQSLDVDLLELRPEVAGTTTLCGPVRLRYRNFDVWEVPFTVDARLVMFGQNITMSDSHHIVVIPNLWTLLAPASGAKASRPVGQARAVRLVLATLDLGAFNIPAPEVGASFAFSVWMGSSLVPTVGGVRVVQGPVQLELNMTDLSVNGMRWTSPFPRSEALSFAGLLVINVYCTASGGAVQLFVNRLDLGLQQTAGCWNASSSFLLGDPDSCNSHGEEYDDVRLWKRALALDEVQRLEDGLDVATQDVVAHLPFDHIFPTEACYELRRVGVDLWCPSPSTVIHRSLVRNIFAVLGDRFCSTRVNYKRHPLTRVYNKGAVSVPSCFTKLPSGAQHKILRAGSHATVQLGPDIEDGTSLFTYALHPTSQMFGLELVDNQLSYSAPELEGEAVMTVNVSYSGCDVKGACQSGLVFFHVQPRGPSITRFQVLPKSNLLRLFFSEPTNTPNISVEQVPRLLDFSGLPPDLPGPTAVEWATDQSLRLLYPAASMWRLVPGIMGDTHRGVANLSVRIKTDLHVDYLQLQIRDAQKLKYPCDDMASSPELLICREGTSPQYGEPGCEGCKVGNAWTTRDGCLPCEPGRYQPNTGQVNCDHCPVGRYATDWGMTSCESCESSLPGSTTVYEGMRSHESCTCPAGWTWSKASPSAKAECQVCTEGLLCPGGWRQMNATSSSDLVHRAALQAAGFSAGEPQWNGGEPSFLVRCSSRTRCPGGLEMGMCPPLAIGRACERCAPGAFLRRERCRLCEEADETLPLVIPFLLPCLAAICIYWFGTRPSALFDEKRATLTTSCSVLLAALQVVGALAISEVPWPEPIPTMKGWLDVVMLQVDHQGFQCFVNVGDTGASYLGQLALYPTLASSLTLVLLLKRRVLRQQLRVSQIINMQGLALMSLFTSIAALSVTPLKCRTDNPDGSSTLEATRSVVCWHSDQHQAMLGGSLVACLVFVVGFIALLAWATAVYPAQIVAPGGGVHLARFRFLFWPYTPKRYYFGLLFGLRKLMVALAPLVVVNWGQGQLLLMMLVILTNMMLQCTLWPWRTFKTNALDALIAVMLTTLMATGFMLGNFDVVSDGTSAQNLVISALTLGLGLLCWPLVWYVGKVTLNPTRTYRIFLSHHKVDAGLLARWMKMLLQECGVDPARVFLDSDNLLHLDRLMHTVAHDTENLVVLLTGDTLSRPWCAMEIVAAHRAGLKIVPVLCEGPCEIDDEFLDSLNSLWTPDQHCTMARGGVDTARVREAYMWLRSAEPLSLIREGADVQTHLQLAKDLLTHCRKPVRSNWLATSVSTVSSLSSMSSVKSKGSRGSVVRASLAVRVAIWSDLAMDEPACACRVLQKLLQEGLQESVLVSTEMRKEFQYVLVLLGPGMLTSLAFARLLVQAVEQPAVQDLVPLLVGDFFEFPRPAFWSDLRAGQVFTHKELADAALTSERVEAAYRRLLNTLALRFSGHAPSDIQSAEIAFMVNRIQACLRSSGMKMQEQQSGQNREGAVQERNVVKACV